MPLGHVVLEIMMNARFVRFSSSTYFYKLDYTRRARVARRARDFHFLTHFGPLKRRFPALKRSRFGSKTGQNPKNNHFLTVF